MMKKYLVRLSLVLFGFLALTACKEEVASTDSNVQTTMQPSALQNNQAETVNTRPIPETMTDQIDFNGLKLMLVDRQGGCLLKTDSAVNPDYQYLKPMAPCYFVRQANQLQTFVKDDVTVIAFVGTPVKGRCGQESQGVLIKEGVVTLSTRIGQGSTFCADSGLDSFHFSLFLEE